MSGKVHYGETIIEAAERELKEETNLKGKASLIAAKHYRVFAKDSEELLEDKIMFLCIVDDPEGESHANEEGRFEWVAKSQLKAYITKPFETWEVIRELIGNISTPLENAIYFQEENHFSEKF